ncbi:hypothetical protein NDR87_36620 [Nocardia sp. CDC159]|uniref:Uncharacterized protein n=1 Tax=Nocardia pulmonis TaxID=2951408 RepID=A0A9X2J0W7_9NOCA|nr:MULTISPECIES: hypothetical protein [Nocardia]MCM6779003.1 hypothetical protein [Nocardia pulmonis]MCM6791901.1 hypothetical protein [Nocardia sp. CDC159]
MPQPGTDPYQLQLIDAYHATRMQTEHLWLRYFAIGGTAGLLEIDGYLNGLTTLAPLQHDILACAINERLDEITPPRAPYHPSIPAGADLPAAPRQSPEPGQEPDSTDRSPS